MRARLKRFGMLLIFPALIATGTALAAGGTLIVLNKSDDNAHFIDLASGETVAKVATGHAPHEAVVSADGRTLVVSNYGDRDAPGNSLSVIDIAKGKGERTIDLGEYTRPHGLAFIDGSRRVLVTAEGQQALITVDILSGEITQAVGTGQRVSHMVAAAPADSRAFVANIGGGNVTVIDYKSGKHLRDVVTGEGAEGIAVSPNGKEVWVSNRGADTLTVLDSRSLEVMAEIPCADFPIRLVFMPDNKYALVSNAKSGDVAMFEVAARKELRRFKLDLSAVGDTSDRLFKNLFGKSPVPIGLLVHPNGTQAYVATTNADSVLILDLQSGKVSGRLPTGKQPDGLAYTPQVLPKHSK